jgi:hypothetical protein
MARKNGNKRRVRVKLTELFTAVSPSILAFISKVARTPVGKTPLFPTIFGTGFFVNSTGIAVTNRHVVEVFSQIPRNPKTGEAGFAAILFLPGPTEANRHSWQMLVVDIREWYALSSFTSSDRWYGQTIPDIGFVQLGVQDVQSLTLATEEFYLRVGMDIATVGYPMGTLPLTALGKLNQVSPFLRRGIVSSVFPFPAPLPHGFTIDIMQQGGSSGSPIFNCDDCRVVGMMSSSVPEVRVAQSEQATLAYSLNTNISIAESAHVIQSACDEVLRQHQYDASKLPTLTELRERWPLGSVGDDLTWDSWSSPAK